VTVNAQKHSNALKDLTIVIPVHNGMPFIKQLIERLIQESHLGYKIIISEDSSTDGTKEFLETLNSNFISILNTKSRVSIAENWTLGVSLVETSFVKLLCGDDIFFVDFAIDALILLRSNPNLVAITGQSEVIDSVTENKMKFRIGSFPFYGKINCHLASIIMVMSGRNIIGAPSAVVFRTDVLKAIMPWDGAVPYMIDVATYMNIFRAFKEREIQILRSTSSIFRLTPGSITDLSRGYHNEQWNSVMRQKTRHFGFYKRSTLNIVGFLISKINSKLREQVFKRVERDRARTKRLL
jgi:glycosyltransferase involved in cell wall biosynthesis